jgi:hypothetical protein
LLSFRGVEEESAFRLPAHLNAQSRQYTDHDFVKQAVENTGFILNSKQVVVRSVAAPIQFENEAGMTKRRVTKPRGYPDRRGMGAQSDFIAEQFVPNEEYKAQQTAMVQKLVAAGVGPEQLEGMFFIPADRLSGEKPKAKKPENL